MKLLLNEQWNFYSHDTKVYSLYNVKDCFEVYINIHKVFLIYLIKETNYFSII